MVLKPAAMNSSGSSSTSSPVKTPASWSTNMYGGRCAVATLQPALLPLCATNAALHLPPAPSTLLHCKVSAQTRGRRQAVHTLSTTCTQVTLCSRSSVGNCSFQLPIAPGSR